MTQFLSFKGHLIILKYRKIGQERIGDNEEADTSHPRYDAMSLKRNKQTKRYVVYKYVGHGGTLV